MERLDAPTPEPASAGFTYLTYFLYLAATVTGVPMFIGVIFAYTARDRAVDWLDTHHRYQIRTFWIMWVYLSIATLLLFPFVVFGITFFGMVGLWVGIRSAIGLIALSRRQPVARPNSWLF